MFGYLKNFNTLNEFEKCDIDKILDDQGKELMEAIKSKETVLNLSKLFLFTLLTYADLKNFKFFYRGAFPALSSNQKTYVSSNILKLKEKFNESQISKLSMLLEGLNDFTKHPIFFLNLGSSDSMDVILLSEPAIEDNLNDKSILVFCDPSSFGENPGWPLRNILTFVSYHWYKIFNGHLEVLCLKMKYKDGIRLIDQSIILQLYLPIVNFEENIKYVGWERNLKQDGDKPNVVNLKAIMDPICLADSAVDLNLKLMKWRLMPELELSKIASCKCLLLGSGTLGCNVARALLGWGVKKITFVDNSQISYSNPVRQSLFVFEDCLHGGKQKAETAAQTLKKIYPSVDTIGLSLSIPMPGHFITDNMIDEVRRDIAQLEDLMAQHDTIFLLMDTRESRWLPTLIGKKLNKMVISVALGFDTYLVIRHGSGKLDQPCSDLDSDNLESKLADIKINNCNGFIPGNLLGCYFCNDVVAPRNSTVGRTLDQQCTVTRPGLSMIASAYAVELLVSILSHPLGDFAPGQINYTYENLNHSLSGFGLIPHQVRGFLSSYSTILPACQSFDKCIACSTKVLESYEKEGFDFLLRVFNQNNVLEDLTGLTQLLKDSENLDIFYITDDDDESIEK